MIAKINRLGFALCTIYLLLTLFLLWGAYSAGGDFKGQFVLLQLPLILPIMFLDLLGLIGFKSWLVSYLVFVPMMLILLYYVGVGITRFWHYSKATVIALVFLLCLAIWFRETLLFIFYY
jgi:hypothetical protein